MKRLTELIKEDVMPIQHIFELSDELLKRAIDKSKQQNTTLSKRRAREFEKWLNNPRRIELQELANNSKEKQILMKAKKEHFDVAIEALKNKNKKVAAEHFETYFDDEWRKALQVQTVFGKIKINTGKIGFVRYSNYGGGRWYVGTYDFDLGNFSRKRDNATIYNETLGMEITFTLEDDDYELRNYDYRKEFDGYISFYFYKGGSFSAHLNMPYYVFPPSYKDDYEKMYKHFHDNLGIQMKNTKDYGVFGKQDLNDRLSVSTVVHNHFFADLDDDTIADVLNKFVKVLRLIDPKCDIEIGISQREIEDSNFWIGNARQHWTKDTLAAKLTFCGKEHLLTSTHSHGIMGNSARISFDDIRNGMSAAKTDWGDGCWTGGNFSVNDEVCKILEKDRAK